jgi:hypothetical protein
VCERLAKLGTPDVDQVSLIYGGIEESSTENRPIGYGSPFSLLEMLRVYADDLPPATGFDFVH